MRISAEGYIGIGLALVGLGGGGALAVSPLTWGPTVGWAMIAVAASGLVLLAFHHYRNVGWSWRGAGVRRADGGPTALAPTARPTEGTIPRFWTIYLAPVEESRLLELVRDCQSVISHFRAPATDSVYGYAEEVVSILRAGLFKAPSDGVDATALRRLHELLVLLKGNGVFAYADTNIKRPPPPDPMEIQLIVAFAAPAEHVEVEVDNGQPVQLDKLPF